MSMFLPLLMNIFAVRELTMASRMLAKRSTTTGTELKIQASAAASGPTKHFFSMHLS